MILIDAIYINNSGGRVLLNYFVDEIIKHNLPVLFAFDKRCEGQFPHVPSSKAVYIEPRVIDRHSFYKKNHSQFTSVFCFSNIPPTVRLKAVVGTYFHNVLLVSPTKFHTIKDQALLRLKSLFISFNKRHSDYFIFQSEFVRDMFCERFDYPVNQSLIFPFFPPIQRAILAEDNRKKSSFLYVSDGNPHKNHLALLKAWELVSQKYPHAELHLTVSGLYPSLLTEIARYQQRTTGIINHGFISRNELSSLYQQCRYIVYPSVTESFGLGLLEGAESGCSILASDLPYVHAVVKPSAVFDPLDPVSISQTIQKAAATPLSYPKSTICVQNQIDNLIRHVATAGQRSIVAR